MHPSFLTTANNASALDDASSDAPGQNQAALGSTGPQSLLGRTVGVTIQAPRPMLSPERIPPFSDKKLSETDEIEGTLDPSPSVSQPAYAPANKARVRDLWDGDLTTAPIDASTVLREFAAAVKSSQPEVAARFTALDTRPARELFRHFDRFYGAGHPQLTEVMG